MDSHISSERGTIDLRVTGGDKSATSPSAFTHATLGAGRALAVIAVLVAIWWAGVAIFQPAPFILPGPVAVATTLFEQGPYLLWHAGITLTEIILGLILGSVLGIATALAVNAFPAGRRFVMPVVMASQALPVFAIAPLLILWFGLGLGSKIAMATLIIYFPVASALNDGLTRAQGHLIDLARLWGASPWQTLTRFRLPAAMPSLASGLRVAATIAPIGAVVGEWVGAAGGIGFVINQANARMQTDTVFAGLVLLMIMVVALRAAVDFALDRLVHWAPRTQTF
ncbi:ABC transporter permease [Ahrensia sp. R2A130]|uniref:ABC transporter permease n=1 Tax=Ahrensia sp. R2A130 TaxID=744979 RepID=UPI0001E0ACC1|nr:ABC transporter permease [Ahrensia sp. R2A130]EFL88688.1 probable ABC transporter permease protein [Ahrensia sp. R2A130]